jgi:adenine-specific DNA-methyltransferase
MDMKSTSVKNTNVKELGQVFTPASIVDFMLELRRNRGRILEPSCGVGYFSDRLEDCVAIELDPRICPAYARNCDFFAFDESECFESIIGNPPYVRFQDIGEETRRLLDTSRFDARTNLYVFFIDKCLRHLPVGGELILITPRDFLKATSARRLNRALFELGTVTHLVDMGDLRVFEDATPNCVIWRYVKGEMSRATLYFNAASMSDMRLLKHATVKWQPRRFVESNGHLSFTEHDHSVRLDDFFFVKVGAVSGADDVFANSKWGNQEFVCSETCRTGDLRKMIYRKKCKYLEQFKDRLLARRIREFDESNWWEWGRDCFHSTLPRIYVNMKTRHHRPFFRSKCDYYDGSVLALFPRDPNMNLDLACDLLNGVDWEELGFVCDGRYIFGQRSLQNAVLPTSFSACLSDRKRKVA